MRPPETSIGRVTRAVRPMRVSTPSSCRGVPRELLGGERAHHRQQDPGDDDERDTCRGRRRGAPPSCRPARPRRTSAAPGRGWRPRLRRTGPRRSARATTQPCPECPRPQPPGGPLSPARLTCASSRRRHRHASIVVASRVHEFPAGRFAVWATAWLPAAVLRRRARRPVRRQRAPRDGPARRGRGGAAGWALTALRSLGERRFRLVLPVPGDVRGLPAAPGLAALALDAGQAAVGDRLALVPETYGAGGDRPGRRSPGRRPARAPRRWRARCGPLGALDLAVTGAARTLADWTWPAGTGGVVPVARCQV